MPGGIGTKTLVAALLTVVTSSQVGPQLQVLRELGRTSATVRALQGLLTAASKRGNSYAYNTATVPLLAEALKFAISACILRHQLRHKAAVQVTRNFRASLLFLVPSVIYWVHNNVQFATLRLLDPATYQVLGNLKIVTTGVLFWVLLRRQLTVLQWLALVLLMLGAATSQVVPRLALWGQAVRQSMT